MKRLWEVVTDIGIAVARLREVVAADLRSVRDQIRAARRSWRLFGGGELPGYREPCEEGCQQQHMHIGPGQLFWAPAGTQAPTKGWDGWISLGSTTDGYSYPQETGGAPFDLSDIYQDINEPEDMHVGICCTHYRSDCERHGCTEGLLP